MHDKSSHDADMQKLGKGPVSIAFGLERLGLIAVKAPIVSCVILLALVIGAIFGIQRIKIDDSLSQLFRSDSKEYRQYEEVTKRFPSSEFDVLVVVEGKTLLARENLEKIRDLVTDLQLVDGPFSSLNGTWRFQALDDEACKVLFTLEYAFSNRALEMLVGPVFNRIATSFIDSFTKRANDKYGD